MHLVCVINTESHWHRCERLLQSTAGMCIQRWHFEHKMWHNRYWQL